MTHPLPPEPDLAARLTAWAECVQRLIKVAPTSAVMDETGARFSGGGHSTPSERKAIREAAAQVVAGWLARDLAALAANPEPARDEWLGPEYAAALGEHLGLPTPSEPDLAALRDEVRAIFKAGIEGRGFRDGTVAKALEAIDRAALAANPEPPEGTRLVLVSDGLFEHLADRVEWGEPDEHGWYTPTLYRDAPREPA